MLGIRVKGYGQRMTLDQSQYAAVILKPFLDDTSPPYLFPWVRMLFISLQIQEDKYSLKKENLDIYKQLGS